MLRRNKRDDFMDKSIERDKGKRFEKGVFYVSIAFLVILVFVLSFKSFAKDDSVFRSHETRDGTTSAQAEQPVPFVVNETTIIRPAAPPVQLESGVGATSARPRVELARPRVVSILESASVPAAHAHVLVAAPPPLTCETPTLESAPVIVPVAAPAPILTRVASNNDVALVLIPIPVNPPLGVTRRPVMHVASSGAPPPPPPPPGPPQDVNLLPDGNREVRVAQIYISRASPGRGLSGRSDATLNVPKNDTSGPRSFPSQNGTPPDESPPIDPIPLNYKADKPIHLLSIPQTRNVAAFTVSPVWESQKIKGTSGRTVTHGILVEGKNHVDGRTIGLSLGVYDVLDKAFPVRDHHFYTLGGAHTYFDKQKSDFFNQTSVNLVLKDLHLKKEVGLVGTHRLGVSIQDQSMRASGMHLIPFVVAHLNFNSGTRDSHKGGIGVMLTAALLNDASLFMLVENSKHLKKRFAHFHRNDFLSAQCGFTKDLSSVNPGLSGQVTYGFQKERRSKTHTGMVGLAYAF